MPVSTPDRRYIVVRGRLWRAANPNLAQGQRDRFVRELMSARRAVGEARKTGDREALALAGQAVDGAKVALGERGPPWWSDGAPDFNRRMVVNTPYRDWWAQLGEAERT